MWIQKNIKPEKLLAVTSFISPQDSVFKVFVFRGSPLGSTIKKDSAAVKDALVTISDGIGYDTLYLTFEINPNTGPGTRSYRYSGKKQNVIVTTGGTYQLNVQTPSGENIHAECTIPPTPGAPAVTGERENDDYNFIVQWRNDPPRRIN